MTVADVAGKKPPKLHTIKCPYCPKVFKRSEHCARHELSHTNQKPFSCQFCHKSYARKDLVKRHERTIHVDLYNALTAPEDPGNTTSATDTELPTLLGADSHADQANYHGARIEEITLLNDNVLRAHDQTMTDTREAASSDVSESTKSDQPDPASFRQPRPIFFADVPNSLGNSGVASTDAVIDAPGAVDIRNPETPLGPSLLSGNEQPNFNINGLLTASYLDRFAAQSSYIDALGSRQPQNKRQRSSNDSSGQITQGDESVLRITAILPSSENADDVVQSPDLDFFGPTTGDINDALFFQQLVEQHDRFVDTLGLGDTSDPGLSQFLCPSNVSIGSSLGQSLNPKSDYGTEKLEQQRLPVILKEKCEVLPHLIIDEAAFRALSSDIDHRLGTHGAKIAVPNRRELQHFFDGYLGCFHQHLPIMHLPTLEVSMTPSPLILAMCCIGALYRLERRKAREIYLTAVRIMETFATTFEHPFQRTSTSTRSSEERHAGQASNSQPLWWMQTRFLLLLYAVLGSDTIILQSELERMGVLMVDYRTRRSALEGKSQRYREPQWQDWIETEMTKRLLCAMFIQSSLLVLLYDFPPGFSITRDLEIELLDQEKLWNAPSAEHWRNLQAKEPVLPARTIRNVMEDMLAGKIYNDNNNDNNNNESLYYVSGFTGLVIIHAVNVYAWNLGQLGHLHFAPSRDLSGVASNTILTNALTTLARCGEVLQIARPEGTESFWNSSEGPLLLNCEAILRVAHSRLFLSASMPEGVALLLNNPPDNVRLLTKFVAAPQERTILITKVMISMCEAFSVPSKAGYLLVQKTAAINWSIEHAVAGWSCVFLLSKWLHNLEVLSDGIILSSAELEIVSEVKMALEGMETDYDGTGSLAAAVVASWAPLMTDVWVWGVTTKMGTILMDLAQIYDASFNNTMRRRNKNCI